MLSSYIAQYPGIKLAQGASRHLANLTLAKHWLFLIDNIYPMVDAAPKALWLSTISDTYNIYSRCDEVQV
jgi:hypothetical protein